MRAVVRYLQTSTTLLRKLFDGTDDGIWRHNNRKSQYPCGLQRLIGLPLSARIRKPLIFKGFFCVHFLRLKATVSITLVFLTKLA